MPALRIRGKDGGFTLLEVLLAFLVFALSFATVLEIMSGSIRNTVRAKEFTEAALIAQSVMDQVGLEIPLEEGGGADGESESGDYRWALSINPFTDQTPDSRAIEVADLTRTQLLHVELIVEWGDPGRERQSRFSTVRAILAEREP